ncbi:AAA family ATPase [Lactococcus petauri]|uniref:AAA family ATPase n=1 Tax=Lactococcus petauri TaxID=1940789 RepID=UPI0038547E0D
MQLHKHEVGEKCIFCGNEISEIRWEQLSGFFNDEVAQLNKRIEKGVETTRKGLEYIETLQQLDPIDFYSEFRERVLEINLKISKTQAECREFLLTLQSAIKDKYNSLFISCDALSLTIPDGFFEIEKRVEALINDSNNYSEQLDIKQSNATDNLRYHEIKVALDEFNYSIECEKYSGLKSEFDIASENLVRRYQELEDKRQERSNLILETRDERKIADKINVTLRKMGVSSFSLELIEDDEGQKGQYKIREYGDLNGGQGQLRTIHELSKGEKNIIAFLYFIFSIEATPTSNPKIIVLDDPMTSNDDSLQYLMIAEIKELYESFKETNNCAILLTHNVHFYLNT